MVVIESGLQSSGSLSVPLWHTRILWESIARDGTVSASSTDDEGYAEAPVTSHTYEWWRPASLPATWEVDAGEAATCDAVGIAVHDIATQGCAVAVQTSDDGESWTEVDTHTPSDDSPILFLFEPVTARYWRIRVTGDTPPRIGVIYIGEVLAMERPVQWMGHDPGVLSRNVTVRPSESERGQSLGRTVIRGGYTANYQVENLPEDWVRETFDPFVLAAQTRGYFAAWRPEDFPKEVLFGWTDDPIVPQNSVGGRPPREGATRRRMSVSWSLRAHGGYEQGVHPWA